MKTPIEVKIIRPFTAVHISAERLPTAMRRFLETFVSRIGNWLGLRFFLLVPEQEARVLTIQGKLDYLIDRAIVQDYFEVVPEFADEPRMLAVQVNLRGNKRLGYSGYGRSLADPAAAWGPAFGEALERWCLDHYLPPESQRRWRSVKEIREGTGVDLTDVPGIGETTRNNEALPTDYRITDASAFLCVPARDVLDGREKYLPLQWFSFAHARQYVYTRQEPQIFPLITTGSAAGQSHREALLGGLCEIIERDAFMIYWARRITPTKVDIGPFAFSRQVKDMAERYRLETHFLYLKTDMPTHVIACVVIDRTGIGPAVAIDASAGSDLERCLEKAYMGAVGLRPLLRRQHKRLGSRLLDQEQLTINDRSLWWYETDKIKEMDFLLSGEVQRVFPDYYRDSIEKEWNDLIAFFRREAHPVYYRDIISPDLHKAVGTSVVSVKAPTLIPMHLNERERTVTGERLFSMPRLLGLTCGTEGINEQPHPFA